MLGVITFPEGTNHNPYPVAASGFLFGSLATCALYGMHTSQIARYYHRFGKSDKRRYRFALVPAVFGLSSFHIAMVVQSMYHYMVLGILNRNVWGELWWTLTAQDFLIPTVSFVAHTFFGYRVWSLWGGKKSYWNAYMCFVILVFSIGIVFSVLARLWAQDPWMPYSEFASLDIGPVANVMPTVWFSCAATIDGAITMALLFMLLRERHDYRHTRELVLNIVRLTLETVLLTHAIGLTLFVLWLCSRTRSNMFWFLLEIIAETYSLSILFTLNARDRFRKASRPDSEYMINRQLEALSELEAQTQVEISAPRRPQPRALQKDEGAYSFQDMLELEPSSQRNIRWSSSLTTTTSNSKSDYKPAIGEYGSSRQSTSKSTSSDDHRKILASLPVFMHMQRPRARAEDGSHSRSQLDSSTGSSGSRTPRDRTDTDNSQQSSDTDGGAEKAGLSSRRGSLLAL